MKIKRLLRKIPGYQWLRYRTWEKRHILKMRYLEPRWIDEDTLVLHSVLEILSQFVEYNNKHQIIAWNSDKDHKKAWKEMNELYKWWIKRQKRDEENPILQPDIKHPEMKFTPTEKKWINPQTKKEEGTSIMEFVHKSKKDKEKWEKACNECAKWEKKCYEEDEKMLIKVIKLRSFMWT